MTFFAQTELPPVHLAIPVKDLASSRAFYGGILGCREGRHAAEWVDFDFFGHQVVAHVVQGATHRLGANAVDSDQVPVPHFGVVLTTVQWQSLADRLEEVGVTFIVPPHIRFRGGPGEQATMFLLDPSGNALEFKTFADPSRLFAT